MPNIVDRICDKFGMDYRLELWAQQHSIALSFAEDIPQDLVRKVKQSAANMQIYISETKDSIPVRLIREGEGRYALTSGEEVLYRYADKPGIDVAFYNYDPADAIAWTLYAIAANKEKKWMTDSEGNLLRGSYVTSRCFSAKQQAAAARILISLENQQSSDVPEELITQSLGVIRNATRVFTKAAPLFSGRPIRETAFEQSKIFPAEYRLRDLARIYFGNPNANENEDDYCPAFEEDVAAYISRVVRDERYQQCLDSVSKELMERAGSLPSRALERYPDVLRESLDMDGVPTPEQIDDLLKQKKKVRLSPSALKKCFEKVDDAWLRYAERNIQRNFLQEVCARLADMIKLELDQSQQKIISLNWDLQRFLFVDKKAFDLNTRLMGWEELMGLQDTDFEVDTITWNVTTLMQLQSKQCFDVPGKQLWLCREGLKNQVQKARMTDQYNTTDVPLTDTQYVFGLWINEGVPECI